MTNPDELRKFVQETRLMRESRQTFKAMVASGDVDKPEQKRENLFDKFVE